MSTQALSWSRKWHVINEHRPDADRYAMSLCGSSLYRNDDPRMPEHLKRIRDGQAKSTGVCKLCARQSGIKVTTVQLPDRQPSGSWNAVIGGELESVYIRNREIVVSGHLHLHADEARDLAGALLAAAEATL